MSKYEYCNLCGEPTDKAGRSDDSIYLKTPGAEVGPLCNSCHNALRRDDLAAELADARRVAACRLIEDGMVLHADGRFVVTTYAVLAVRAALAQAGGEA